MFRYNKGRPSVEKYQHRYLTGLMSLLPFNLICKDYLTDEEKKVIEDMDYNFLPPWDPMGALAKE